MRNNYPKSASLLQKPARKRSGQWRLLMAAMAVGLTTVTAWGQATQSHRVSFSGIDGFSGEVSFTSSRHSFGTTLKGKGAVLKLTDYNCTPEEKATLQKAGLDFWGYGGYVPKSFGVYIEGRAYVGMIVGDYFSYYAKSPGKLHLTANLGDEISFDFDQKAKDYEKEWRKSHPQSSSLWVEEGGFREETVTELYLSDLKTKIQQILYNYKKEKDRFAAFITQGTQEANQYHFEAAESALASAVALAENTSEMNNKISTLKKLIADKKSEKEKQDKKEAEEKEKKEAEQKEKAEKEKQEAAAREQKTKNGGSSASGSTGGTAKSEHKDKEEKDRDQDKEREPVKKRTVYRPKTNRELYNELKAMTDKYPEMLNDPKIRTRLRGYKALADRDDRNMRDYQSFKMITGGGYHPSTAKFIASTYKTNGNIAMAEVAVGGAVDAATGIVNSIIDEQNRKQEERNARYKQQEANARAKKEAIQKWENDIREKRNVFENKVQENIKKDFELIATIPDLPITYESQKYIAGGNYFKGNRMFFNAPKFETITKTMQGWGKAKTYNLYIAELNGLYGILGDDGEALYPPQFGGIYVLQDVHKRPRFLVNIEDKWGEILADGSITEEVKYDGIWYTPDRKNKLLKYGDQWSVKSIESGRVLKQFSSRQVSNLYAGGLIPVYHTLRKGYIDKEGSYSLGADGKVYVWGKSTEEGVTSIPYESARRGQFIERLFKIKEQWYITANYGTNNMTTVAMPSKFVIEVLRETGNGKKWGAINQDGVVVVPFEHKYIRRTATGFTTDKGNYNINK